MDAQAIEGLRQFYVAHRQELFSYALVLSGSATAAEDAIQNAFSGVLLRGRVPRELRPYLFRCVRNAAMDERRRTRRDERNVAIFNGHDVEGPALRFRLDAEHMLAQLSDDEREIVVLKVYTGMTFREIARTRRIPQGTAASLYRRAIQKLRTMEERTGHG